MDKEKETYNDECLNDELKALYKKWNAEITADPYMSQLTIVYEKWLDELRGSHPYLLENDIYSNPSYIYVPKEWQASENKIMIVGEEGYGKWGCGKQYGWTAATPAWPSSSYNDIRLYHRDLILSQTKFKDVLLNCEDGDHLNATEECRNFKKWFDTLYGRKPLNTNFWQRIYSIYNLGRNAAIIWNNLDKIFALKENNTKRCALTHTDRVNLHSVSTKLLEEEIKITRPTIVIFNGWYGTSIKAELRKIYDKFYEPTPLNEWEENRICTVTDATDSGTIKYICAYHPAFRANALKGRFNNDKTAYEKQFIETIKSLLK